MYFLPLTLETPAANLALDEALLNHANEESGPNVLRIWEPAEHFVVLGRASEAAIEVDLPACRDDGVSVWQRPSGGGVVVLGPGCLTYSVVRHFDGSEGLLRTDQAHQLVLERHAAALRSLESSVRRDGLSDLTLVRNNVRLKFSGNSLRIKRQALLYHGTILYQFDLSSIGRWLRAPKRQPDYRADRSHADFVANFPAGKQQISDALASAWQATTQLESWPRALTAELVRTRYRRQATDTRDP